MAYDSTIPALGNLISNDIPAMQENFSLLESAQVVDEGSTEDGGYIRYENGWQICFSSINVSYEQPAYCLGSWSFPVSFNSTPNFWAKLEDFSGSYAADMGVTLTSSSGSTGISIIRQYRVAGGDDFTDDDDFDLYVFAIGRWK